MTKAPDDEKSELEQSPEQVESSEDDAAIGLAFRRSLAVFALVGLLVGGGFLIRHFLREEEREVVGPAVAPTLRDTKALEIPELPMTRITDSAGIDFQHNTGATGEKLLPETMGSGCAFIDYDNDGDQDLFLVNSRSWPWDNESDASADANSPSTCQLFANDGSGNFENVTEQTGAGVSLYGMGVAVGDFDNDGWTDLFITGVGTQNAEAAGPHRLLKNTEGKFVDVTETAGVQGAGNAWGSGCGFADFNNDGLLDLFVCNYVEWSRELDLEQGFKIDGTNRRYGPPRFFAGTYPSLYQNEGGGKFKDVSSETGLQIDNRESEVALAKSLGLAPVDLNDDGWMDFIVANDTVRNLLFINQKNGKFLELGELYNIAYDKNGNARGAMGIDVSWFRDDGSIAVCIGNFANEPSALFTYRSRRNQFFDAAMVTGLGPPTRQGLTFGMLFCDIDLDGRLDVIGANGHLEQEINKFFNSQTYKQPMQLFWNAGQNSDSELVHVPADKTGDAFRTPIVGRGSSLADIDGDGDCDLVVTTSGGVTQVFRNDQECGNHWVRFALVGTQSNRSGIGAKLELHAGGKVFRSHVMPTRSYLSQSELPVTFGLGKIEAVEKLIVRWPGGTEQTVRSPAIDTFHTVTEQQSNEG